MKRILAFLLLLPTILIVAGCGSRVSVFYNNADFLIRQYARVQLDLNGRQLSAWEPRLAAALTRHRREELPHLAAFVDRMHQASQAGFDPSNTACLTASALELYQRQARIAVALVSPLLADLTPAQIEALNRTFEEEAREDAGPRDRARERAKRVRRYITSIEDWTGPLGDEQRAIVADVTARLPDSRDSLVAYRTHKRAQLIALLRAGAEERRIEEFMRDWLVDFSDLPADLRQAGDRLGERWGELLVRLGASLDAQQRERLERRLAQLRDELMRLQRQPSLAPMSC